MPAPLFSVADPSFAVDSRTSLFDQVYGQPIGPANPLVVNAGYMNPPVFSPGPSVIPGAPNPFIQNTPGTGAAIVYSIVAFNHVGQDTMPSANLSVPNNAATPNNTLFWLPVPGAAGYKVLKNGSLLAIVGPGAVSLNFPNYMTYTDSAGATGSSYTPATSNPQAYIPIAAIQVEGQKTTYRASFTGLSPVSSATDVITISGNATKIVRPRRIELSGVATSAAVVDAQLLIRSTANSGGTSSTPTVVALDSSDPAGTAVVTTYTANPTTLGTLVGQIGSIKLPLAASPGTPPLVAVDFGTRNCRPVTLRGAAQLLCVNFNAETVGAGGSLNGMVEWTEE
jgi:hypothetical protein